MSGRVDVANAHQRYRIQRKKARDYVRHVLRQEGKESARISVVFVDGAFMRRINRKFLQHDYATDVIAFPLGEENLEGEVYVNLDRARTQADRFGVSFGEEVARLVIHGTLHLLGYDDRTRRSAALMKQQEDEQVRYWFSQKRKGT